MEPARQSNPSWNDELGFDVRTKKWQHERVARTAPFDREGCQLFRSYGCDGTVHRVYVNRLVRVARWVVESMSPEGAI